MSMSEERKLLTETEALRHLEEVVCRMIDEGQKNGSRWKRLRLAALEYAASYQMARRKDRKAWPIPYESPPLERSTYPDVFRYTKGWFLRDVKACVLYGPYETDDEAYWAR